MARRASTIKSSSYIDKSSINLPTSHGDLDYSLNIRVHNAKSFLSVCSLNRFPVSDDQLKQLEKYTNLLLDWNRKLNLISRGDESRVWERHILHSASLLFHFTFTTGARVMDLGTGGGLPGIPIKILAPHLSLTLLDSIKKKSRAVEEIVRHLSLPRVHVAWGRAEDLGRDREYQNQYDYVIARGVGTLANLVKWSFPLLRPARSSSLDEVSRDLTPLPALIAMKGGDLDAEIRNAERDKRVEKISVKDLVINGLDDPCNQDRKIVIVMFN